MIYRNLGACRHVATLFSTSRDAESLALLGFLARTVKRLRRRLKHRTQPRIGQILQAEFGWIDLRRVGELVHVAFWREKVCRGCQPAIGAAAQRALRGVKLEVLVGDTRGGIDGRHSLVVIVKLPGC